MSQERLQKILARAGIASRRAAEEYILAGRVEVNGQVVRELGTRAEAGRDQIRVDGKAIVEPEADVYYVLYKPEGVVTTLSDPEGRRCVGDFLRSVDERVFPVGRLDYDAEGVLLLTSDGGLAHKLTHPRWGVRRTYLAKVKGEPSNEVLERLTRGVRLEDGKAQALEATFERATEKNTWIRLVVAEGRPHLVKRLCEAVGHPVVRLFRSDYAGIDVDGMKPGDLRPLLAAERKLLVKAVEKEAPLPPGGIPRKRRTTVGRAVRDPILGTAPRRSARGFGEEAGRGRAHAGEGRGEGRRPGGRGAERGFAGDGGRGPGRAGVGGFEGRRSGPRGAERGFGEGARRGSGFAGEGGRSGGRGPGREFGGSAGRGRSFAGEGGFEGRRSGARGAERGFGGGAGRGPSFTGEGGFEGRRSGARGAERGFGKGAGRGPSFAGEGGPEGRRSSPRGAGRGLAGGATSGARRGSGGGTGPREGRRPATGRTERTSRPRTGGNSPGRPGGRGGRGR
jgi:23S rRNA pseudouridine2605 synthase